MAGLSMTWLVAVTPRSSFLGMFITLSSLSWHRFDGWGKTLLLGSLTSKMHTWWVVSFSSIWAVWGCMELGQVGKTKQTKTNTKQTSSEDIRITTYYVLLFLPSNFFGAHKYNTR